MKRFLSYLPLFLLIVLSLLPLQAESHFFSRYLRDNSLLPHDGVRSLLLDSRGVLWAGTQKGLYTRDGEVELSYDKHDLGTSSEYVCAMAEDVSGNVWIGTDMGIVVYRRNSGTFHAFRDSELTGRVTDIECLPDGTVWFAFINKGLFCKRPDSPSIDRMSLPIEGVYKMAFCSEGDFVLSSYSSDTYRYRNGSLSEFCGGYFRKDNIEDMRVSGGMLYLASKVHGLCRVDLKTEMVQELCPAPSGERMLSISEGRDCIWTGTTGGLVKYFTLTGDSELVKNDPSDRHSLSDNFVRCVIEDENGKLWVGTENAGLNCYDPSQAVFRKYYQADGESLEGSIVRSFAQDGSGNVWVATEKAGLLELDADGILHKSGFASSLPVYLTSVCVDDDRLWVGSQTGLFALDLNGGGEVQYFDRLGELSKDSDNRVICLFKSSGGELYVATTLGVSLYDRANSSFGMIPALNSLVIETIAEDRKGRLWLASFSSGVFCYDPASKTVTGRYNSAEGNSIVGKMTSSSHVDAQGNVWVAGFNSGFFRYVAQKDDFEQFCRSNVPQLPTDLYLSVLSDDRGCLWLSSDAGLVEFDVDSHSARIFTQADGLLSSNFKKGAIRLADGSILMAQSDGFIGFRPEQLPVPQIRRPGFSDLLQRPVVLVLVISFASALLALLITTLAVKFVKTREKRRQEERERIRSIETYNEKMNLIAGVVHEIKTPLTLVRTPLKQLFSSGIENDENREDIEIIGNSMDYLEALVKELLEFISVEQSSYVLDKRDADIGDRVDFLCSNFKGRLSERGLKLIYDKPQTPIVTAVDSRSFAKMINCLLDNAVKYADKQIALSVTLGESCVKVTIANDGPAISKDRRKTVFEPFRHFEDDAQKYSKGFGIGLALTRQLAQLHDGSLELSDREDMTEFVITLPLCLQTARRDDDMEEMTKEAQNLPMILLVEDNQDLAQYVRRALSNKYRVITAASSEKAMELVTANKFDLVITDIGLPGMSGIEFCARLGKGEGTSHIPVIILSAISSVNTKIQCMENGATTYIEKPFSMEYLAASIKSALEKRRSIREQAAGGVSHVGLDLPDRDEEFVRRLDRLVTDNMSNPDFTIKMMEEGMTTSRSSLHRKVTALLGYSPNDYLRQKRLETAAELIASGKVRINEVCYAVGFNSPSYFAKCFKAAYGMMPSDYAEKNNNTNTK